MKLTIKTEGFVPKYILLDGKDISKRVREINVNLKGGCIPTVTLEFIPDEIEIDGDFELKRKKDEALNLGLDEQKILNDLGNKYLLKPCKAFVKELKQDLINLCKDENFLKGFDEKLDFLNIVFEQLVTDPYLYEKEKLTLEDLKG